ncbi:hypothetical protein [Rickettsiales endosymbiont of Trichoplax sp. H2]|uniref:hypothetical protein n=1 Tax=Rickettsiales endosymbiont of Trichoplax sp. H2 TaxID=2021221 RepID=UPI0012B2C735|nr:hypothetical protein [Rickettsiales endosymbiont of Trichoplax sp. H2]MSO13432.1 hypothetical protein [Rickettsiales endosymbiont of Trichoplax sp. H2]
MINTKTFKLNNLTENSKNDVEEKVFVELNIPKFKVKHNSAKSYIFHFNNKIEKIQADTAYEAINKYNLKNFNKVAYIRKDSDTKSIFAKDEITNNNSI